MPVQLTWLLVVVASLNVCAPNCPLRYRADPHVLLTSEYPSDRTWARERPVAWGALPSHPPEEEAEGARRATVAILDQVSPTASFLSSRGHKWLSKRSGGGLEASARNRFQPKEARGGGLIGLSLEQAERPSGRGNSGRVSATTWSCHLRGGKYQVTED